MAIRDVLKMGDPRLLEISEPVAAFGTPELESLLADMRDTMQHLNGAGLAAPQIGVNARVVIFGVEANPRYPEAEAVPYTVLINPELTPLGEEIEEGAHAEIAANKFFREMRSDEAGSACDQHFSQDVFP